MKNRHVALLLLLRWTTTKKQPTDVFCFLAKKYLLLIFVSLISSLFLRSGIFTIYYNPSTSVHEGLWGSCLKSMNIWNRLKNRTWLLLWTSHPPDHPEYFFCSSRETSPNDGDPPFTQVKKRCRLSGSWSACQSTFTSRCSHHRFTPVIKPKILNIKLSKFNDLKLSESLVVLLLTASPKWGPTSAWMYSLLTQGT